MSILDTVRAHGRHRLSAAELRDENVKLLNRQAAADDFFALLIQDRDEVYACWQKAAEDRDTAEQLAADLAEENQRLWQRLAPLEAAEANRNAIDVPAPATRLVVATPGSTNPADIPQQRKAA